MASAATKLKRAPLGETQRQCPICESPQLEYKFIVEKSPVCECQECGLMFLNPQPATPTGDTPANLLESDAPTDVDRANAAERLEQFIAYSGAKAGKLLIVGADTQLLAEAARRGFEVQAFTPWQFELAIDSELPDTIEACILFCALERMKNPLAALKALHRVLTPGGSLMVISPT